jgi:uncharacterized protein YggU (UPF0235/DUF167 family)
MAASTRRTALEKSADTVGPARRAEGTLRLDCRLRPGARRNRIVDIAPGADGAPRLRAEVGAAAEGGKANRALIKLVADFLGLAPSRVSIAIGATRHEKTLAIEAATGEEWARIVAALTALGEQEKRR